MTTTNIKTRSRRSESRRTSDRRSKNRRIISYEFGSPEWIDNIQNNYLVWPKEERRKEDRRKSERRANERRSLILKNFNDDERLFIKSFSEIITKLKEKDLEIVLLPHVIGNRVFHDDRVILKRLYDKLKEEGY